MGVEPVGFDVNRKLSPFSSIPSQNVPKHLFLTSVSFTAHKFAFAMLANFVASWGGGRDRYEWGGEAFGKKHNIL